MFVSQKECGFTILIKILYMNWLGLFSSWLNYIIYFTLTFMSIYILFKYTLALLSYIKYFVPFQQLRWQSFTKYWIVRQIISEIQWQNLIHKRCDRKSRDLLLDILWQRSKDRWSVLHFYCVWYWQETHKGMEQLTQAGENLIQIPPNSFCVLFNRQYPWTVYFLPFSREVNVSLIELTFTLLYL